MKKNKSLIITGSEINLKKYTSGQEYYLQQMISTYQEIGYPVQNLPKNDISTTSLSEVGAVHFYYVPLKSIVLTKVRHMEVKSFFHIYHLEDIMWGRERALKWKTGLFVAYPFIDKYLVTSLSLLKRLKRYMGEEKLVKVDPFYSCQCGSFNHIKALIHEKLQRITSRKPLRILYLGRYNPKRVPLSEIIPALIQYSQRARRQVQLKIVSTSQVLPEGEKKLTSMFTVKFVKKYLSEKEKCELYQGNDLFIYLPKGNVAMKPPITILEAVYHGIIPIVTTFILKDLPLPPELAVEKPLKIRSITQSLGEKRIQEKVKSSLSSFSYFYNKSRYVTALKQLF